MDSDNDAKRSTADADESKASTTWPPITLSLTMGAGGTTAENLGANVERRSASISLSSQDVARAMAWLGWEKVENGQGARAAASLSALIESALESAGFESGYNFPSQTPIAEALKMAEPQWIECIEGRRLWGAFALAGGIKIESGSGLDSSCAGYPPKWTAKTWEKAHDEGSMKHVSAIASIFEELGCAPNIRAWKGFQRSPRKTRKADRMPKGAAICAIMPDNSAVCSWISPSWMKKFSASPLSSAFGGHKGLWLLPSIKPLRLASGPFLTSSSYMRNALPGDRKVEFPCVCFSISSSYRGHEAASADQTQEAFKKVFGRGISEMSVAPHPDGEDGAFHRPAVEAWLASLEAKMEAKKIARQCPEPIERTPSKRRI